MGWDIVWSNLKSSHYLLKLILFKITVVAKSLWADSVIRRSISIHWYIASWHRLESILSRYFTGDHTVMV